MAVNDQSGSRDDATLLEESLRTALRKADETIGLFYPSGSCSSDKLLTVCCIDAQKDHRVSAAHGLEGVVFTRHRASRDEIERRLWHDAIRSLAVYKGGAMIGDIFGALINSEILKEQYREDVLNVLTGGVTPNPLFDKNQRSYLFLSIGAYPDYRRTAKLEAPFGVSTLLFLNMLHAVRTKTLIKDEDRGLADKLYVQTVSEMGEKFFRYLGFKDAPGFESFTIPYRRKSGDPEGMDKVAVLCYDLADDTTGRLETAAALYAFKPGVRSTLTQDDASLSPDLVKNLLTNPESSKIFGGVPIDLLLAAYYLTRGAIWPLYCKPRCCDEQLDGRSENIVNINPAQFINDSISQRPRRQHLGRI